ncbi:hypothetical protein OROMI_020432 [Orobanche minor]
MQQQQSTLVGTKTQKDQWMVEQSVARGYAYFDSLPPNAQNAFLGDSERESHSLSL